MTGGTIAVTIAATPASDGTIAGILARIGDTIAVARGVTIAAAAGADTPKASGVLGEHPSARGSAGDVRQIGRGRHDGPAANSDKAI